MKIKYLKIVLLSFITLIIVSIVSIFIYLEIISKNYSKSYLPYHYSMDVNNNIYQKLSLLNEKKNDSLYTIFSVGGKTPNSNLFFTKYYKKTNFKFSINKNSLYLSEVKKYDNQYDAFLPTDGIFNENHIPLLDKMDIYVENHNKISKNLYECKSKYFYMKLNNSETTLGIFKNKLFYIQLVEKKNYILLAIFSSDSKKELNLFRNFIKD